MNRRAVARLWGSLCGALVLAPTVASAQVGPGTMPTGTPGADEDKPDGVAESAPKTPGLLPTTPTLPPPKGKRNRFELFEMNGYLRFRGDWFKNFNLGFRDDPDLGGAPFPLPLGCGIPAEDSPGNVAGRPCDNSVTSTNMRLRLEPTINVNETTSVHLQVDVLDNLVLGSTPIGSDLTTAGQVPVLGAFNDGQVAPQQGINSLQDSIVVKRAWAEVQTPLGVLKFGRMPDHWGLGIWRNSGAEDPIHGTYNLDADYGDNVDRVMFGTLIPGTRLRAAVALDWPSTRLVSTQTDLHRGGQGWDLDDNDDISQWVFVVSRMDTPDEFQDAVDRGELALNYGAYFAYRTQDWDYDPTALATTPIADQFVPRGATAYVPDVWARLGWGDLTVEVEALLAIGSIDNLGDVGGDDVSILQWGGVARGTYRALDDELRFGLEVGAASGDEYEAEVEGRTHISNVSGLPRPGDEQLSAFRFDPDYHVDLILFRELIGTVTNALYLKPFVAYEVTEGIELGVANITSFALKPVATPGNSTMYGTEFDASVRYSSGAFHAGLAYGVLFPLDAMNHPGSAAGQGGDGFDWGENDENAGAAENAHTIQGWLAITF